MDIKQMNPFVTYAVEENYLRVKRITGRTINVKIGKNDTSGFDTNFTYLVEESKRTHIVADDRTPLRLLMYGENAIITDKGRALLLYILQHLDKEKDYIKLETTTLLFKLQWKDRQKVANAKKELQTLGLIALKSKSEYWINPLYIFNGDKIKYYETQYPDKLNIVVTLRASE